MFFKNLKLLCLKKAIPNINNPIISTIKNVIICNIPSPHILANYNKIFQIPKRFCSSSGSTHVIDTNPDPSLRIKRLEYPEPCKFGFVPETWISFFHKRTGVTGFYTFLFTVGTYLCSKEIYVLEHEFYTGLSMIILCILAVKYIGPELTKFLDKEIDEFEKEWNTERNGNIENLNRGIENEKKLQWSQEGTLLLMDAKRKNVEMQLEHNFRERQMIVYQKVLRMLNLQLVLENIRKTYHQRNRVEWITAEVMKNITPDQEAKSFEACLQQIRLAADEYEKKDDAK